jgi:hypothetical protein
LEFYCRLCGEWKGSDLALDNGSQSHKIRAIAMLRHIYHFLNGQSGETTMRIAKDDIPVRIDAPGAVARQQPDFGDASGLGAIGAEYFSLAEGADLAPLLAGLDHDMCHSPHWGYIIEGALTVTYRDGAEESAATGDLFYWPPYHSVRFTADTEMVLFSPQHEHEPVMDHVRSKIDGA